MYEQIYQAKNGKIHTRRIHVLGNHDSYDEEDNDVRYESHQLPELVHEMLDLGTYSGLAHSGHYDSQGNQTQNSRYVEEMLANKEDGIGSHQDHRYLDHGIIENLAHPENGNQSQQNSD